MTPPRLIIAAVLVFTVALHLPGLNYGLPFMLANDELPLIGGALRMIELRNPIPSMNPGPMEILYYPPGLPWLYVVLWSPVLAIQWMLSGFPSASRFADELLSHLGPVWVLSRFVSVLFLAGTVWAVIRLTAEVTRDRIAAIVAGALIATSFHHAILGDFARVWSATVFFFWWGLWACWRIAQTGERRPYVWAALAAGLGFAVNYIGVLVSFGVAAAHVSRHRKLVIDRGILLHAALVALSIAVILPASWPNFVRLFGVTNVAKGQAAEGGSLALFYVWTMLKADLPLLAVGLAGLPFLIRRAPALFVLFLVVFIPYSAVILSGNGFDDRYIIPLTPLFAIAGGELVALRAPNCRFAAAAAVALVVAAQAVLLVKLEILMTRPDTRQVARAWAATHVPAGEGALVALRGMTFEQTMRSLELTRALAPAQLSYLQRRRLAGARIASGGGGPEIDALEIRQIGPDALRSLSPEALLARVSTENYRWLLIDDLAGPIGDGRFEALVMARAKLVTSFAPGDGAPGPNFNLTDQFAQGNAWNLMRLNRLGPLVRVYRFE